MGTLENILKRELNLSYVERTDEIINSGLISKTHTFESSMGKLFVKENDGPVARTLYEGEFASLKEVGGTNTITVPKPIKIISSPPKYYIVLEYIKMRPLKKFTKEFGRQIAKLHMYNEDKAKEGSDKYVSKFGFYVPTCSWTIPRNNEWCDSWSEYFIRNIIEVKMDLIQQKFKDEDIQNLWPALRENIPKILPKNIKPSLVHGDLWLSNAGENDTKPLAFDCSSFYGHSEWDIAGPYNRLPEQFYEGYHELLPPSPGFSDRKKLYQTAFYLNRILFMSGNKGIDKEKVVENMKYLANFK